MYTVHYLGFELDNLYSIYNIHSTNVTIKYLSIHIKHLKVRGWFTRQSNQH